MLTTHSQEVYDARLAQLEAMHPPETFYDIIEQKDWVKNPITQEVVFTGKKNLFNGDTGKWLGILSMSYNTCPNKMTYKALDRQIAGSDLPLDGAYTRVDINKDGAMVAVHYVFPAVEIDVDGHGDKAQFMITAINSFNGATGFHIYVGALRGYCWNTQVFGSAVVGYHARHSANLNLAEAAHTIRSGIDVFQQEGEAWKQMRHNWVTDEQVYQVLADWNDINYKQHPTLHDYLVDRDNKGMVRIAPIQRHVQLFNQYVDKIGKNEFALYNTLTHIISHGAQQSGNRRTPAISSFGDNMKKVSHLCRKHLKAYQPAEETFAHDTESELRA